MKTFIFITILLATLSTQAECLDPVNCLSEIQEATTSTGTVNGCSLQETETDDPLPVTSQDLEKGKKVLDKDAWKYTLFGVGLAPAAFITGTAIHEGYHCLAAEAQGFDCFNVKVIPYTDETGYFYFGSMMYRERPGGTLRTPERDAIVTVAPIANNIGMISLYSTLAFTDNLPKNKWAKTATFVLGATQVIDLANHATNTHPRSDSGQLIHFLETSKGMTPEQAYWTVKGPQIGFAAIGASALAIEGFRIFTKPKKENTSRYNLRLNPSATRNGFNIGLSGQF